MKRTSLLVITSLALTAVVIAGRPVADAREKWGPFRGQIVDVETGQPIPGAAVLVVWWQLEPNPVQMSQRFYDAREAVTGANGRFEIPRLAAPLFASLVREPQVIYFAPGYKAVAEVVTPPDGQAFVAPTVVQMRRLKTRDERIRHQRSYPPTIPAAKMPLLLDVLNKERVALGLEALEHGGVK